MGLAQTLLTISAIALLSTITLTLNTSYLSTNQIMVESEFTIEAVSIAESFLERAISKSFDEKSITGSVKKEKDFSDIGKDSGEKSIDDYDDFDDFDGHLEPAYKTERAEYYVTIKVVYVNDANPDIALTKGSKSWHKKMTVVVSNEFMKSAPVSMNYIYSYF